MEFGNCKDCKFKISFTDKYSKGFKHWGDYQYVCRRFPPPRVSRVAPYGNEVIVKPNDGCYEFKQEENNNA